MHLGEGGVNTRVHTAATVSTPSTRLACPPPLGCTAPSSPLTCPPPAPPPGAQVETGSAITWKYPSVVLKGDGSVGEFYSVALTNHKQQADTGARAAQQTNTQVLPSLPTGVRSTVCSLLWMHADAKLANSPYPTSFPHLCPTHMPTLIHSHPLLYTHNYS